MAHSNKGPAARVAPKNQPGKEVVASLQKAHVKAFTKSDMRPAVPTPPGRAVPASAGTFGHAVIPARFGGASASSPPKAAGSVMQASDRHAHPASAPKPGTTAPAAKAPARPPMHGT